MGEANVCPCVRLEAAGPGGLAALLCAAALADLSRPRAPTPQPLPPPPPPRHRAGQGGRQSAKDAGGKYAKSAGSRLRRYNEVALQRDVAGGWGVGDRGAARRGGATSRALELLLAAPPPLLPATLLLLA